MKRKQSPLALLLGCLITSLAHLSAQPVILNWSTDVTPSDIVTLQGDGFAANSTVWCSLNRGTATQLTVYNNGDGILQAQLPTGNMALYGVYVKNGAQTGNTVYLNRANPMHFDTPEIAPGGTFRIFGRNLSPWNSAARVIFTAAGQSNQEATVTAKSSTSLTVTAPAGLQVGTTYTVLVFNGLGSSALDWIGCPVTMLGRAGGTDPFGLGVPWGPEFAAIASNVYNVKTDTRLTLHAVGDNTTNDQPAIQNAINTASNAGGGVVYIPAGNYRLLLPNVVEGRPSGTLLKMKNNVVVKGDGMTLTKLNFGYDVNPQPAGYSYTVDFLGSFDQSSQKFLGIGKSGITRLSLAKWTTANEWKKVGSMATGVNCNRIFLVGVAYDLANSEQAYFISDRVVIRGCLLSQRYEPLPETYPASNNLLVINDSTNFRIYENILQQVGGIHIASAGASNGVIENNTLKLDGRGGAGGWPLKTDGSGWNAIVRHGITVEYAHEVAILGNSFTMINGVSSPNNDGECIASESGGSGGRFVGDDFGRVLSSTSNSLTVSNSATNYAGNPAENDAKGGSYVAIINGKGRGQIRKIQWRSANVISISGLPWAVNPDATSNYSVFFWSLRNVTIGPNNTFTNWPGGAVVLYTGPGTDNMIIGNSITDQDGVWLQPSQVNNTSHTNPNGEFRPVWNMQVEDNEFTSHNTGAKSRGTYVNLTALVGYGKNGGANDPKLYGTLALNVEIKRNTINASGINGSETSQDPDHFYNYQPTAEGFINYIRFEPTTYQDQGIPALLGAVFMWNDVYGYSQQAFLINGGAYRTLIGATDYGNYGSNAVFIRDSTLMGRASPVSHTSVGTISIDN